MSISLREHFEKKRAEENRRKSESKISPEEETKELSAPHTAASVPPPIAKPPLSVDLAPPTRSLPSPTRSLPAMPPSHPNTAGPIREQQESKFPVVFLFEVLVDSYR